MLGHVAASSCSIGGVLRQPLPYATARIYRRALPHSPLGSFGSQRTSTMSGAEQSATVAAAQPSSSAAAGAAPSADPVVQYVVLRKDLWSEMKWPLGSVVAQACHASTAVMWMNKDDAVTCSYLAPENLDHMHKVVLEVKNETQLRQLSEKLTEAGIAHKMWIEQPENFPTCLAVKPYPKSAVAQHMKKFQLCKQPLVAS